MRDSEAGDGTSGEVASPGAATGGEGRKGPAHAKGAADARGAADGKGPADGKAAAGAKGRAGGRRRRRLPRWADRLLTMLMILLGVGLMVWPWVVDRLEEYGVGATISEVSARVESMPSEEKQWYLDQARSYNQVLAGEEPDLDADQIVDYSKQLTYDRDPMMSWVDIPSIDVSMPIYHGTSESALMAGVGHLEGTSLPVGGESTHCVITAHSGMRNLRMFDDIRQLVPGDLVLLHTMGDTYAYRVTSSEVVWPDEVSSLGITPGEDLLTLVTCTPYGVNDHRLLVHCVRTDYVPEEAEEQGSVAERHWGAREWAVVVVVVALAGIAADVVVHRVRRAHGRR
ncbi:MAG: class C sortase [Olsenella sp.]